MDERNDVNNENEKQLDEIVLPGFRFHPTDEELVGVYLKRKIQQRPLSIELIKQIDIYKFDPWDLPKLATTGAKEWYFYCPRDRKYRNSARPNRVTGAGFWKATGTDRPIYSSEGNKCIGLKKSLVFYKGKAAKGIKTDWMMHEFRLPSLTDSLSPPKRFFDKTIPANDSWAICRILKKTNSTAHRALSQSWVSPLPAETASSKTSYSTNSTCTTASDHHFSPSSIMNYLTYNFNTDHDQIHQHPSSSFSTCRTTTTTHHNHGSTGDLIRSNFMLSPPIFEPAAVAAKCNVNMQDVSSFLSNGQSSSDVLNGNFCKTSTDQCLDFDGSSHDHCRSTGFSTTTLPHHHHEIQTFATMISEGDHHHQSMMNELPDHEYDYQYQWDTRSVGFPFSSPMSTVAEARKQQPVASDSSLWDSSSCPSDQTTSIISTTKRCT